MSTSEVYKPPDVDVELFNDCLTSSITKIGFENKLCYIMGDYNINLINYDSHSPTKDFIDLLSANSLYPTISKPTRITSHSATLIDNIFTNNLDRVMVSGILYSDLSDHLPVFQITNYQPQIYNTPAKFKTREITQSSIANFQNELHEINWDEIASFTSPNESYNRFSDILLPIYNKHFPLKTRHTNTNVGSKPWFSTGLHNSCCKKNLLYKNYLKDPTPANKLKYAKYRNKYNYIVKLSRKKYYHDKLEMQKHNLKTAWSTIKSIIGAKPKVSIPSSMKDPNGEYTQLQINLMIFSLMLAILSLNVFLDLITNIGNTLLALIMKVSYYPPQVNKK